MKYCIVIADGAAGIPLPERAGKTCLELAETPNLDALARSGIVGLARTVPEGMEPSSACACMSVLGYDPRVYYRGRSGIEAKSLGIPFEAGDVFFRCNLVAVRDGRMWSYSSGHITTEEARELVKALNESLGSESVRFYPGVNYRHILKMRGKEHVLNAVCTPPHDIPDKLVEDFLPDGPGCELLRDLMKRSEAVLRDHPVNLRRLARGQIPATTIWLFWPSGRIPDMPPFRLVYRVEAALTSAVDLMRGLAQMMDMEILNIPGVSDGLNNDFAAQANGALEALNRKDLVVIHVEAPDEAAHGGAIGEKTEAIQKIDRYIVGRLRSELADQARFLVMPDHPTPISLRTHTATPVPFLLFGPGFTPNGAKRLTEAEAKRTRLDVAEGHTIMSILCRPV